MERFLLWDCKLGYFERLLLTWREFAMLERASIAEREYKESLVRQQCFFSIAPYRDKKSKIKRPQDLWKIGDEDARGVKVNEDDLVQIKAQNELLKEQFAEMGYNLRIA